jgi:hypothetical protein
VEEEFKNPYNDGAVGKVFKMYNFEFRSLKADFLSRRNP